MKHFIYCLIALSIGGVLAEDISTSNLIGLLPVTSAAKRTIVAVPWCAMSATDDSAIQVSNLVKTANLTVGDQLHYVNTDGSYLSWCLAEGAGGVKFWQSAIIATDKSVDVSPNAHDQTVARGNSIVLIRQSYTNDNGTAKTFYLYGQVGTNSVVTSAIATGSESSPAYSLISSPKPSAWNVNSASWQNVGANDKIFINRDKGLTIQLVWDSVKHWCYKDPVYVQLGPELSISQYTNAVYTADIPAGQGVWYVSYGGSPILRWTEVPTK